MARNRRLFALFWAGAVVELVGFVLLFLLGRSKVAAGGIILIGFALQGIGIVKARQVREADSGE